MSLEAFLVTHRVVAIVLPKPPFVDWINDADPQHPIDLDAARDDANAFLIPCDSEDGDPLALADKWIRQNWRVIFEQMLDDWYTDKSLWPQKRSLKLFREWCEVRLHGTVFDCSNDRIEIEIEIGR
jgi:hypothetical protein